MKEPENAVETVEATGVRPALAHAVTLYAASLAAILAAFVPWHEVPVKGGVGTAFGFEGAFSLAGVALALFAALTLPRGCHAPRHRVREYGAVALLVTSVVLVGLSVVIGGMFYQAIGPGVYLCVAADLLVLACVLAR